MTKCHECGHEMKEPEAVHYLVWDLCSECGFKMITCKETKIDIERECL